MTGKWVQLELFPDHDWSIKLRCFKAGCEKSPTSYCILQDNIYACEDHLVGDYFWELEEKSK